VELSGWVERGPSAVAASVEEDAQWLPSPVCRLRQSGERCGWFQPEVFPTYVKLRAM
jgi:hypothetical protein